MWTRIAVFAVVLFTSFSALAQDAQTYRMRCNDGTPDPHLAIEACDWLLNSGRLDAKNTAFTYYLRGTYYRDIGQLDRAKRDMEVALPDMQDFAFALSNYANILHLIGDDEQALEYANRAVQLDQTEASIFRGRGLIYRSLSDLPRALEDLNHAIEISPDLASAFNDRGYVYQLMDRNEQAIADYRQATVLDPTNPDFFHALAAMQRIDHRYTEAIVSFDKAIQLNPDNANYYNGRGYTHYRHVELALALADYDKALQLAPDHAVALLNRADLYAEQGEFARAIDDYTKSLETMPDEIFTLIGRARVFKKIGEHESAIADYKTALEIEPDNFEANIELSLLFSTGATTVRNGRLAVQYANAAVDLYSVALSHSTLAAALAADGEFDAALREYEKASDLGGASWVRTQQKKLAELGYLQISIDGVYGDEMAAAVCSCLRENCTLF